MLTIGSQSLLTFVATSQGISHFAYVAAQHLATFEMTALWGTKKSAHQADFQCLKSNETNTLFLPSFPCSS